MGGNDNVVGTGCVGFDIGNEAAELMREVPPSGVRDVEGGGTSLCCFFLGGGVVCVCWGGSACVFVFVWWYIQHCCTSVLSTSTSIHTQRTAPNAHYPMHHTHASPPIYLDHFTQDFIEKRWITATCIFRRKLNVLTTQRPVCCDIVLYCDGLVDACGGCVWWMRVVDG